MFTPARIIVVDNEQAHVDAITNAFRAMGIPCLGMLYDGNALDKAFFAGVRVLLLDLHLLAGTAGTEDAPNFGLIASMLEDYIDENGGPFIVVLWTQNPQQAGALIEYLESADAELPPHCRPLTVLPLAKNEVLNLTSGQVTNHALLQQRLRERIEQNPQINALLSWEAEVHQAAARTLSSVMKLVPPAQRTVAAYSGQLDGLLSKLALEAGGKNVATDIRGAINSVLTPVLSDRLHAMRSTEAEELWRAAVTQHKNPPAMEAAAAGQVNRMLHVESGPMPADTWGGVVPFPADWRADDQAVLKLGLPITEIGVREFALSPAQVAGCEPVLVRIGAVCDYAQKKSRLIPYLLGFQKPVEIALPEKGVPAAVWQSPVLTLDAGTFHLVTSARYVLTLPPAAVAGFEASYRLREQLLIEVIDQVGNYVARPGMVSIHE